MKDAENSLVREPRELLDDWRRESDRKVPRRDGPQVTCEGLQDVRAWPRGPRGPAAASAWSEKMSSQPIGPSNSDTSIPTGSDGPRINATTPARSRKTTSQAN